MKTTVGSACLCALLITAGLEAYGAATNRYVVAPGAAGATPTPPYDSWETAGTNIIEVVNEANAYNAGDHVIISNGTYWLTNQVSITNTVVTNASGDRALVIVNGNFPAYINRCFYLDNSAARLVGLTVTNGAVTNNSGGGIYLAAGCVSNCVIAGNQAWNSSANYQGGGGIFIVAGGTASDCDIIGNHVYPNAAPATQGGGGAWVSGRLTRSRLMYNTSTNSSGSALQANGMGGGALIFSGIVDYCEIISNSCSLNYYSVIGGGGVQIYSGGSLSNCSIMGNSTIGPRPAGSGVAVAYSGNVRNCVIAYNSCAANLGAAHLSGSSIAFENCTIASNYNGGINMHYVLGISKSNIVNCIIWNNGTAISGADSCKTAMVSCCISPGYNSAFLNPGGTTNDPLLVSIETNNFRLSSTQSSCYNRGTNQPWMNNAVDLDGFMRMDQLSGIVDIGAYEYICAGTIYGFR